MVNQLQWKIYGGKINTIFHNHKISKEGFHCICLSVILIDSVFKTGKYYYPHVFLEEYKCIVKKMIKNYFNDDTEIYSDDSDEEKFDAKIFDL